MSDLPSFGEPYASEDAMNSFVVLLAVFRDVPHRSVLLFSLHLNDIFAYLRRICLVNVNSSAPECVDPEACPDSCVAAPVSEDYFYFIFILSL